MKHVVEIKIPSLPSILFELDDSNSPKTVNDFLLALPFTVDLNVWGDEIYSSKSPIAQPEENAKQLVSLYDVAYWPTGKAICLFFGPTPIGNPGEITPASAVNVIGKIMTTDKTILDNVDGNRAEFSLQSN
ncbi:MAG: hypothetical protein CMO15_06120 [Thaumarchaeota archaeon]|nr:hypothetical protein [Nitrososphaerota archaeon]MDP6326980.1 cyclophilin-like family protein [Nitrosopumilus sp.]HJM25300.1 cyclophilin-like family protein [Nitrosopumilus sp.]|tara:strand:+ start:8357 stop:8749 length:393 start_codon:yes stop_codon:yes gene_type:complete